MRGSYRDLEKPGKTDLFEKTQGNSGENYGFDWHSRKKLGIFNDIDCDLFMVTLYRLIDQWFIHGYTL